ncbi:MAG: GNAT family N-acetyltransferase [Oscillospiraceae bacterium]|nr:GNAT family N-acetyltransferase [Oscillospiraceae bacterium]
MEIINFYESTNQSELVEKINQCDWGAARFLTELLRENTFLSTLGGEGTLFLLMDGDRVVSFATLTKQDSIRDETLFPWIGFVYTTPEYRGHRYAGKLLAHAEASAVKQGYTRVFLATDHVGLYEKYGFTYLETRMDVWGNENSVFYKELKGADGV